MKKLLGILVLSLLLSGNAYAGDYASKYKNYFDMKVGGSGDDRKSFKNSEQEALLKCQNESKLKKLRGDGCLLFELHGGSALEELFNKKYREKNYWNESVDIFEKTLKPEDIIEGRRLKTKIQKKEEKEKETKRLEEEKKQIKISSIIERAKSTCKELGFKEETEKFTDCALKLYTQQVDAEAAAKTAVEAAKIAAKSTKGQGQTIIVGPPRKLPRVACEASGGLLC